MVAIPALTALSEPEVRPIVATAVLLLLQEPPVVISASVVELPWQSEEVPDIGAGKGLTVIVVVSEQPPPVV